MKSHSAPQNTMLAHANDLLAQKVLPVQVAAKTIQANTNDAALQTYLKTYDTFLSLTATTPKIIAETMAAFSAEASEGASKVQAEQILSNAMIGWMRDGFVPKKAEESQGDERVNLEKTGFAQQIREKLHNLKLEIQEGIVDDIVSQLYGLSGLNLTDDQVNAIVRAVTHLAQLKQGFDAATAAHDTLPAGMKKALVRSGVPHQPAYQFWVDVACDPMPMANRLMPDSLKKTLDAVKSTQEVFGAVSTTVATVAATLASPFSYMANAWGGYAVTPFDTMIKAELKDTQMTEAQFLDAMAFHAYLKDLVGAGKVKEAQKKELFSLYFGASQTEGGLTFDSYNANADLIDRISNYKWSLDNAMSIEGRLYALYRLNEAYAEINLATTHEAINAVLDECGLFYSAYSKTTSKECCDFYSEQFFPKFKCIPPIIQRQLLMPGIIELADSRLYKKGSHEHKLLHAAFEGLKNGDWLSFEDGIDVIGCFLDKARIQNREFAQKKQNLKRIHSWLSVPVVRLDLTLEKLKESVQTPKVDTRQSIMAGLAWLKPDLLLEAVCQHVAAHKKAAEEHRGLFSAGNAGVFDAKISYCKALIAAIEALAPLFGVDVDGGAAGQYKQLAERIMSISEVRIESPAVRKRDMVPFSFRVLNQFGPVAGKAENDKNGGVLQQVLQFILTEVDNDSLQQAYETLEQARTNRNVLAEGRVGMRAIWFDDALDDPLDFEQQGNALAGSLLRSYLGALIRSYKSTNPAGSAAQSLADYFAKVPGAAHIYKPLSGLVDKVLDEQVLIDHVCRAMGVSTRADALAVPYPKKLARVFFKVNAILLERARSADSKTKAIEPEEFNQVVDEVAGDLLHGATGVPREKVLKDVRALCKSVSELKFKFLATENLTTWAKHCFDNGVLNEFRYAVLMAHCENLLAYAQRFANDVDKEVIQENIRNALGWIKTQAALPAPMQAEVAVIYDARLPKVVEVDEVEADFAGVSDRFDGALDAMQSEISNLKLKSQQQAERKSNNAWHKYIKPALRGIYYLGDTLWVGYGVFIAIAPVAKFIASLQALTPLWTAFHSAFLASPLFPVVFGLHLAANVVVQLFRHRKIFAAVWTFSEAEKAKTGLAFVDDIALRVAKTMGWTAYVLVSAVLATVFTSFIWSRVEAVLKIGDSALTKAAKAAMTEDPLTLIEEKIAAVEGAKKSLQDNPTPEARQTLSNKVAALAGVINGSNDYKGRFSDQLSSLQRAAGELAAQAEAPVPAPVMPPVVAAAPAPAPAPVSLPAADREPSAKPVSVTESPSMLFSDPHGKKKLKPRRKKREERVVVAPQEPAVPVAASVPAESAPRSGSPVPSLMS